MAGRALAAAGQFALGAGVNQLKLFSARVDSLGNEGYRLTILPDHFLLEANTDTGLYYGAQTILQLLEATPGRLPCGTISDRPRFAYRGLMVDCCRHFFSIAELQKIIAQMARYKLNRFHWHLTDDQGWRIEIKKYPRLTQVGGFRKGTLVGHYRTQPPKFDTVRYGGFYTQDQAKALVAYAAERGITIIPEIELPGHAQAAIAAYPSLGCTGAQVEVMRGWGISNFIFNTQDATFTFLQNVLDEVISIFPSRYIHIGGDEAAKEQWLYVAAQQAQLKARGVADEHELQSYFIKRIEKHVNSRGRLIMGWDEILEGGLAPRATVMAWRSPAAVLQTLRQYQNPVVITLNSHLYLDAYQGEPEGEPLAIGGLTTLEKLYRFDPVVADVTPEQATRIKGVQANCWTEYIASDAHLEYMIFPRLLALAEVAWTPARQKSLPSFADRLAVQRHALRKASINAR